MGPADFALTRSKKKGFMDGCRQGVVKNSGEDDTMRNDVSGRVCWRLRSPPSPLSPLLPLAPVDSLLFALTASPLIAHGVVSTTLSANFHSNPGLEAR